MPIKSPDGCGFILVSKSVDGLVKNLREGNNYLIAGEIKVLVSCHDVKSTTALEAIELLLFISYF